MGPLTSGVEESSSCARASAVHIPGYVPPYWPNAKPRKMIKAHKYSVNISVIPQGMVCTTDIVPCLMQMKYGDHGILASTDITTDPYVPAT